MSHPNPNFDSENSYPSDDYKPVGKRKEAPLEKLKRLIKMDPKELLGKKKSIARKMKGKGSKGAREWFRSGQGGHGDLPPGRRDSDNE